MLGIIGYISFYGFPFLAVLIVPDGDDHAVICLAVIGFYSFIAGIYQILLDYHIAVYPPAGRTDGLHPGYL